MAYLVLALGALLSVGGALSIFHGAGIVEVERGWTGVIAGATSLTGGIVTIALGLILKTLLDLRRSGMALQHDRALGPTALSSSPAAMNAANPVEPDLEGGLLAAFLAPKHETAADAIEKPALDLTELDPRVASENAAPLEVAPAAMQVEKAFVPDAPSEATAATSPPRSRFRISFKTPSEAAAPPAPPLEDHPRTPAMDDWLDRAFSSLDEPPAATQPPAQPVRPAHPAEAPASQAPLSSPDRRSAAHDVAELEAPHREPLPSHPRDLDEPAPPPAAPPQSAVIGRYEADGTSYVMFADGSIEAQSEAGVYRFNSMSELKAFIEGTG